MFMPSSGPTPVPASLDRPKITEEKFPDAALMTVARKLEASFLSEMLRHAGAGEARKEFGGGIGEQQFSSFLRDIQARDMSESGGLGLAESLFKALKRQQNA